MSVRVENLTKQYGNQHAVSDISFDVAKGEILGFLGPNGAGKSTTMKIATAYLPPSQGSVIVEGYDVVTHPLEVRRRVGYLPEHNPLYLDMYVLEYLQFIGGLHKYPSSQVRQRAEEMIALTGLEKERKKKIGALSKGYRQRVGLAQALLHDPPVLILDEPTTGLDPNQIVEIRKVIRDVSQTKTVLFSTHIMQEVQALCSRVIIINQGKIVADCPTEQLKQVTNQGMTVLVEFASTPPLKPFELLPEIAEIEHLSSHTYRFIAQGDSDPRIPIFQAASQESTPIIGMQIETASLESVFQQLTQTQPTVRSS